MSAPKHPDAVAEVPVSPAASGLHSTYDTYQAEVGDRVRYDGIEMTVWRVDDGSVAKGQQRQYRAGPVVWARVSSGGLGTMFDASSHEDHDILAVTPQPQREDHS